MLVDISIFCSCCHLHYQFSKFSYKADICDLFAKMPREIITLQLGQCGNQSMHKFSDLSSNFFVRALVGPWRAGFFRFYLFDSAQLILMAVGLILDI